jgi:hypothetical protein
VSRTRRRSRRYRVDGHAGRKAKPTVTALVVGLTVAVALLGLLVAGLLRAHAEILRALHQLGVELDPSRHASEPTPVLLRDSSANREAGMRPTPARPDISDIIDLTGTTPRGDAISLAVSGVRHDTLVGFLTSGCATCRGFWEDFRNANVEVPGGARLVLVTRGAEAESPGVIAGLAGSATVLMSSEAWEHYDIPHAPYFVYISGPGGRIVGEGAAARWDEVKGLMANAVADGTTKPAGVGAGRADSAAGSPTGAGSTTGAGAGPADGSGGVYGRPRSRADQRRDDQVDAQLRQAGIEPGDPRLYPTSITDGGG